MKYIEYEIIAHAFHRKEAVAHIQALKKTLRRHLVKIITRPVNSTTTTHWISEIQNYLDDMCDFSLKQESSLPEKVVYEAIVGKGQIDMDGSIKNIIKKLKEQDYEMNPEYIKKNDLSHEASKLFYFYELASKAVADHFAKGTEINAKNLLIESDII